jgi:hypothetical protein
VDRVSGGERLSCNVCDAAMCPLRDAAQPTLAASRSAAPSTDERFDLAALPRKVAALQFEPDILTRAAKVFARWKGSTSSSRGRQHPDHFLFVGPRAGGTAGRRTRRCLRNAAMPPAEPVSSIGAFFRGRRPAAQIRPSATPEIRSPGGTAGSTACRNTRKGRASAVDGGERAAGLPADRETGSMAWGDEPLSRPSIRDPMSLRRGPRVQAGPPKCVYACQPSMVSTANLRSPLAAR